MVTPCLASYFSEIQIPTIGVDSTWGRWLRHQAYECTSATTSLKQWGRIFGRHHGTRLLFAFPPVGDTEIKYFRQLGGFFLAAESRHAVHTDFLGFNCLF